MILYKNKASKEAKQMKKKKEKIHTVSTKQHDSKEENWKLNKTKQNNNNNNNNKKHTHTLIRHWSTKQWDNKISVYHF